MQTARVFKSGNSQAVRLPKEFRLDVKEVSITRDGDAIVLRPRTPTGAAIYDALVALGPDFPDRAADPHPQSRPAIDDPAVDRWVAQSDRDKHRTQRKKTLKQGSRKRT